MTNVDRALLLSEWGASIGRDRDAGCPCCKAWVSTGARHERDCAMDLALAERGGYPTQVDRDRARDFIYSRGTSVAATLPPPPKAPR